MYSRSLNSTLTKESITNQAQSHLTVRSSTDILDVVPTLLGFIPTESLVIIYLDTVNDRGRSIMTARMDLPSDPSEFTGALKIITQHANSHDAMILVAYSIDSDLADVTWSPCSAPSP